MAENKDKGMLVYVGTYTRGKSEGIYVYRLDPSSGALERAGRPARADNPAFLDIAPDRRHLYAVNELQEFEGKPGGAVSAFSIEPKTWELTFLNRQPSNGTYPCHLSVDRTGRFVLLANYGSGTVTILPIREDGELGEPAQTIQHEGKSAHPRRQQAPHAHSILIDPANRYAFAPDLGVDRVFIYRLDLGNGKLIPNDQPWVQVHPGAGPRHFEFHPRLKYAFVINEIDSTLTAFTYDAGKGGLKEIQTVNTLPEDFDGDSNCADVHVAPSGKFLYGSNRGHDSIVIYAIDENTGELTLVGHEPTQGKNPRNFAIDPTGTFLLAANGHTDNIVTFRIDPHTGKLKPTGHAIEVPAPVCLKVIPLS